MVVGSIACFAIGAVEMGEAARDTRTKLIDMYHSKVLQWTYDTGKRFTSRNFALRYPSGNVPIRKERYQLTPQYFGESTALFDYPAHIEDYRYRDYVRCPGGATNKTCAIQVVDSSGSVVFRKSVMPLMQVGPILHYKLSTLCQWYDGDYWHPMAAMGFGGCNNDMRGGADPQTYNYGPNRCVLDHYLDKNGCPADQIPTQQLVQAGWTWATQLVNKPRFTYENGKCFDYTDCFCSGCGLVFKTDVSKHQGMTGYGFYSNGQWVAFPLRMTPTQRAQMCHAAFLSIGHTCPAEQVTLSCFRAGGYPKKKCSTFCHEQDSRTAVYTPPSQYVTISNLYGPWGEWQG